MKVEYPATEIGLYLALIFKALHDYDEFIRSLIVGLAGRDIRKGMEIFLEFCRSGHIQPEEYLKLRTLDQKRSLPRGVVTRVMLRRNRRYYDGNASFVKNLFQCEPRDAKPDHFVRLHILDWLDLKRNEHGPKGAKGFHQCSTLVADLVALGHDAGRVREELEYFVEQGCIITEHQRPIIDSDDDLIRLSPSGYTHLKLIWNPDYLAACAEETWLESEETVREIAARIGQFGPRVHYSRSTAVANAADIVGYLVDRATATATHPSVFLASDLRNPQDLLAAIAHKIKNLRESTSGAANASAFEEQYQEGQEFEGRVSGTEDYGVFVRLDDGTKGLIHVSNLPRTQEVESFRERVRVVVRVLAVQKEARKLSLAFVRFP